MYATEWDIQRAVFEWLAWYGNRPGREAATWAFAVPNGQYRPGQRMEAGMKAGVPDIFVPEARGGYFGLFIELKRPGGTTSDPQDAYITALGDLGYRVLVCVGFDETVAAIEAYFGLQPTPSTLDGIIDV